MFLLCIIHAYPECIMNIPNNIPGNKEITAVIVAGGRSSRFAGQDKGLLEFRGKPMVQHIIERLSPQVGRLVINANRNIDEYSKFSLPVIGDLLGEYQGPLAGISAALDAATTPYLLTVPCDCPLVPDDLVHQLATAMTNQGTDIAVAHDGLQLQQMFMLLSCALSGDLHDFLSAEQRAVRDWLSRHDVAIADFSGSAQAFININSKDDLVELESGLP